MKSRRIWRAQKIHQNWQSTFLDLKMPKEDLNTLKARSHCDGNSKFLKIFPYVVAVTMQTPSLVTMIPIFATDIAIMNGYCIHYRSGTVNSKSLVSKVCFELSGNLN